MEGKFVLAQISDTHIRADSEAPARALARALDGARAYGADAIVLTGDLVNGGQREEYSALAAALADPPAPLYLLPGNHDDRAHLRGAFPAHFYLPRGDNLSYVIDDFPLRLIALDQIVPGATHGAFAPELAKWLDAALAAKPHTPTIVALHHPPFATHDLLFDTIGLHGGDRFAAIIARHPQVVRIICGHHHRVAIGQVAHAPSIVAPSTSWVYGLATDAAMALAPKTGEQTGWMLHLWKPGAGLASHFMGL